MVDVLPDVVTVVGFYVRLFKLMTHAMPLFSSLLDHLDVHVAGAIDVAGIGLDWTIASGDRSTGRLCRSVLLLLWWWGGEKLNSAVQQSMSFRV
jgi:hypothetical protein